jgi:hypothetical protein
MSIGILPALWLGVLWASGRKVGSAWWWMAAAFGVSFVADLLAEWLGHPAVSQVYPTAQAVLFLFVLVPRGVAIRLSGLLLFISGLSLGLRQGLGLDVALHATAWGGVAVVADAVLAPSRLREALVWGFALLTLAWVWFWATPTMAAWSAVQLVRLGMAGWWCVAARDLTQPRTTDGL